MFQKGDRVLIDITRANQWRRARDYPMLSTAWTEGVLKNDTPIQEGDGTVFLRVLFAGCTDIRNIPVDCMKPVKLNKRAISQMLVRMK